MRLDTFKAYIAGLSQAIAGTPTVDQWRDILAKLEMVEDAPPSWALDLQLPGGGMFGASTKGQADGN